MIRRKTNNILLLRIDVYYKHQYIVTNTQKTDIEYFTMIIYILNESAILNSDLIE